MPAVRVSVSVLSTAGPYHLLLAMDAICRCRACQKSDNGLTQEMVRACECSNEIIVSHRACAMTAYPDLSRSVQK